MTEYDVSHSDAIVNVYERWGVGNRGKRNTEQ